MYGAWHEFLIYVVKNQCVFHISNKRSFLKKQDLRLVEDAYFVQKKLAQLCFEKLLLCSCLLGKKSNHHLGVCINEYGFTWR